MSKLILLILGLSSVLLFTIFTLAILNIKEKINYILAFFVISFANIILVVEFLSLLKIIFPLFVLIAHWFVFLAVILPIWIVRGKPFLLKPFHKIQKEITLKKLKHSIANDPMLWVFGLVLLVSFSFLIVHEWFTVENNADVVKHYYPRIGLFLQSHQLFPVTEHVIENILSQPLNGEISYLWTVLWWKSDQLASFVQVISLSFILLGIFGISRLSGIGTKPSILTVLVYSSFPLVFWNASVPKNDVIATVLIISSVYFFYDSHLNQDLLARLLAFIALGLALGTKSTTLFVAPFLIFFYFVFMFVLSPKTIKAKNIILWISILLICFLFFGGYVYIQNQIKFDFLFGSKTSRFILPSRLNWDLGKMFKCGMKNSIRNIYSVNNFTVSNISSAKENLFDVLNNVEQIIFDKLDSEFDFRFIGVDECSEDPFSFDYQRQAFGPQFTLFWIPGIFWGAYQAYKKKKFFVISLLFCSVGFLFAHSMGMLWVFSEERYYILPLAILMPLFAYPLECLLSKRYLLLFFIALCSTVIITHSWQTYGKVVLSKNHEFWNVELENGRYPQWTRRNAFYGFVDEVVPEDATVVVLVDYEVKHYYPLFGDEYSRTVIPYECSSDRVLVGNRLIEQDIDYIVAISTEYEKCRKSYLNETGRDLDAFYEWVGEVNYLTIYRKTENTQPIISISIFPIKPISIVSIPTELHDQIEVIPLLRTCEDIISCKDFAGTLVQNEMSAKILDWGVNSQVDLNVQLVIVANAFVKVTPIRMRLEQNDFEWKTIHSEQFIMFSDSNRGVARINLQLMKGMNYFHLAPVDGELQQGDYIQFIKSSFEVIE